MDQFQLQNEQMNHGLLHQQQQQMQEQEQQMHQEPVGQQQQMQAQAQAQQHRMPTVYERFFQNLKPLPHIPVAQGPAPVEAPAQTKAQRREQTRLEKRRANEAKSDYADYVKQMKETPRLMDEGELHRLKVFQSAATREAWAKEKLPHSALTREDTLKQILNDGDYSNFENLDQVMRNVVATRALKQFLHDYDIQNGHADPAQICQQIRASGAGVSALLNPGLRLALSLVQNMDEFSDEFKSFCRRLDDEMSTEVMVATLTAQADGARVVAYYSGVGNTQNMHAVEDANRAIEANKAQQIQIAKRLLLMQLSDFSKITTDTDGNERVDEWDRSMAVALSHCSRVVLTMPKIGEYAGNADEQQAMWRSIMTINGENTAQDNRRASSTHSIERRRVVPGEGATLRKSKEKKVLFNFIGQRGMNCAIGGLGNPGVGGKTILNNGSCGHFYSMYKEGDEEHYGAMLMGMESDAHGVMNQMGHTHDIHATPEKASSFGGQRTDEVGNKYGGRQCDLSKKSAREITRWMTALERKMQEWQSQPDGMSGAEAEEAMRLLAGESLHVWNWTRMSELLGMDA